jgi:hypothetical protein
VGDARWPPAAKPAQLAAPTLTAMASAFARWKGSAEQVAVIPGFLKPIDTNAIARQLRLSEKGSERGAEELPHSDEAILDGIEQTVIQKIESEWAWQGDALLKTLRAYADRLVGYSRHGRSGRTIQRHRRKRSWLAPSIPVILPIAGHRPLARRVEFCSVLI